MIGYCATGSRGMAITPIRQMNSATTQAKTGLSMKKPGMVRYRVAWMVRGGPGNEPTTDASASVQICGLTLSPAANF